MLNTTQNLRRHLARFPSCASFLSIYPSVAAAVAAASCLPWEIFLASSVFRHD